MFLRNVEENDCHLLWEWANDLVTRQMSFNSEPISWKTHVEWFKGKIRDPKCFIFIAFQQDTHIPIGQIRFELIDHENADISIVVAPNMRSYGYGSQLILKGVSQLFLSTPIHVVHAYIRPENSSSLKVFAKVGFSQVGFQNIKGIESIHMCYMQSPLSKNG